MKIELNPNYPNLKPLVENIEHYFQQATEVLYNERNQIRVVNFKGEDYVVKSFKVPNLINQIAYRYLRPSKAKRSYEYSLKIGKQLCPEAIAYIEEYKSTLLAKSYYISKRYQYDFTIRPVLLDNDFDKATRERVLKDFADFSYVLHEKEIFHRDYSYGNILIRKVEDNYQFKIIDVNRMQFKTLTTNDRLGNFARLSADNEAMEIIITRYAQHIKKPADEMLATAKQFRDEYMKKRVLKNKLRGR